jgi:hypothetical protein
MVNVRKSPIPLATTCVVAGLVLAILAPLGTDQFSILFRLIFWVGLCFVGGLGAGIADIVLTRLNIQPRPWLNAFAQSVIAALAVSSLMLSAEFWLSGTLELSSTLSVLFYVWVISAAISTIGALIRISRASATQGVETPLLFERLPPPLRSADLYALAAEDHYVRVITSKGDELILMRLSDAIKETAPLKGLAPHRSWWVSETGIAKMGKSEILLHSHHTVPISRSGKKLVREAGWA